MSVKDEFEKLSKEAANSINKLLDFINVQLSAEVTPFDVLEYVNNNFRIIPTLKDSIRRIRRGKKPSN